MKRVVTAAAVAVVLLASSACGHQSPRGAEARLRIDRNSAVSVTTDGTRRGARGSQLVRPGSVVRVGSGSATLDLADGGAVDLRRGSAVRIGRPLELLAGEALVRSGKAALAVRADGTLLTVDGVGRLGRSLAVTAASYRGVVAVDSAGRTLAVPALRRTTVPDLGLVPASAVPIAIAPSSTDAWERRYLGIALDLTPELESRSAGFSGGPNEVRQAFPSIGSLPFPTRAGDALVGAAVVAAGDSGTPASRWQSTFRFRDQGAAWGLVVLDQSLRDPSAPSRLIHDALSFLFARSALAAPRVPVLGPVTNPSTAPAVNTAPAAPAPTGTTPATLPAPSSPAPPPNAAPVPPTGTPLGPVIDPIIDPILGTATDVVQGATTPVTGPVKTLGL